MQRVAIAWLRAEDWPRWQKIDPNLGDYDSWLRRITAAMEQVERAGIEAEKVIVDPEAFSRWCKSTGNEIGTKGRSIYAAGELMHRTRPN